jgi:hypothetical protein
MLGRHRQLRVLGVRIDAPRCTGGRGCGRERERGGRAPKRADTFESKYGRRFTAPDRIWFGLGEAIRGGDAVVYRVAPPTALRFRQVQAVQPDSVAFLLTSLVRSTPRGSAMGYDSPSDSERPLRPYIGGRGVDMPGSG